MLKKRNLSDLLRLASAMVLILALSFIVACGAPAADDGKGKGGSSVSSEAGKSKPYSEEISEERAKELALSHAKVKEADFIRVELDYDDGKKHWDLEFYKDGFEYDYEIAAESGEILSFSKEKEGGEKQNSENKPNSDLNPESDRQSSGQISEDEARSKALSHAGVSAAEAVFGKIELDRDDRRPHWELEFRVGRYEYDCSVDLESGQVFDFEKDLDD